ncbi:hypothetical protein Gogos_010082 [Gossypium gossypioides]|uniref:RNase H type-1 domain-containing protein n=1 Tax=Gossypium gossypioides TaxID=34282 RepID=A0A7J9BK13_GOSGO|nr:hypothetical protein [Gossypium gossypioides]
MKKGEVIVSKITCHSRIPSPFGAEEMACTVAMILCLDLGLRRLVVEGGSLTVIKKLKFSEVDRSKILAYIEDIKKMSSKFLSCTFMHVQISANTAAHQLASEGLRLNLGFFGSNGVSKFAKEMVEQYRCWVEAPE